MNSRALLRVIESKLSYIEGREKFWNRGIETERNKKFNLIYLFKDKLSSKNRWERSVWTQGRTSITCRFPDGSPCLSMHRRELERVIIYSRTLRRLWNSISSMPSHADSLINIRKASRTQISSRDSWFDFSFQPRKTVEFSRVTRPLGVVPISLLGRFAEDRGWKRLISWPFSSLNVKTILPFDDRRIDRSSSIYLCFKIFRSI